MVHRKKQHSHGHGGKHHHEKRAHGHDDRQAFNNSSRDAVNLNVLRRHDSSVSGILGSTSHTVVYLFNAEDQSWAKIGIEGAMFVFERESSHYGLTVMNRLGTNNFTTDVTAETEVEMLGDYIILRTLETEVYGLWVYEPSDRQRLYELLQKCHREPAPKAKKVDNDDIMRFFKTGGEPQPESKSEEVDLSVTTQRLKRLLEISPSEQLKATPNVDVKLSLDAIVSLIDSLPPSITSREARQALHDDEIIGRLVCLCQKDLKFREEFVRYYKSHPSR